MKLFLDSRLTFLIKSDKISVKFSLCILKVVLENESIQFLEGSLGLHLHPDPADKLLNLTYGAHNCAEGNIVPLLDGNDLTDALDLSHDHTSFLSQVLAHISLALSFNQHLDEIFLSSRHSFVFIGDWAGNTC